MYIYIDLTKVGTLLYKQTNKQTLAKVGALLHKQTNKQTNLNQSGSSITQRDKHTHIYPQSDVPFTKVPAGHQQFTFLVVIVLCLLTRRITVKVVRPGVLFRDSSLLHVCLLFFLLFRTLYSLTLAGGIMELERPPSTTNQPIKQLSMSCRLRP